MLYGSLAEAADEAIYIIFIFYTFIMPKKWINEGNLRSKTNNLFDWLTIKGGVGCKKIRKDW